MTRPTKNSTNVTTKTATAKTTTAKTTTAKKTTAKKTTRRRATAEAPAQPGRLPAALRITGEILMDRPPRPGAHAHRRLIVTDTDDGITRSPAYGIVTAACRPLVDDQQPQPYAQLSAGWADHHYHATACPDCFPDTTGEARP